jgi:nucleoside-diphosphate-sugar epimerase
MTMGHQIRDFTPVELVADIIIQYATDKQIIPGNPIIRNLGTGIPKSLKDFASECWNEFGAKGKLIPGAIQYRKDEIMRYVPDLKVHNASK